MKYGVAFLALVFSIIGCKESKPPIDFGKSGALSIIDTTYKIGESEIPASIPLAILIEDLTGIKCSNCPKAAQTAKHIKDTLDNSDVFILAIYPTDPKTLTFPEPGYPDIRTETSQLISSNIYEFGNFLPGGGVNRKLFNGQPGINISFNVWENFARSLVGEKAIVKLEIEKEKTNDSTYRILNKSIFNSKPVGDVFMTVLLLEDGILHPQKGNSGTIYDYVHNHVLRKAYTPYNGAPLNSSSTLELDRGVVVEKGIEIVIPDEVNQENASIMVILSYNESDNKEVLQCQEIKLK